MYQHLYFVDGNANAGDAFFGGQWRTVLVSGLGRGGQAVFALDITDPSSITETNAGSKVLWEFRENNDNGVRIYLQPTFDCSMANGEWAAVFGSGYANNTPDGITNTNGNGYIYIVRLSDWNLDQKTRYPTRGGSRSYGLGYGNGVSTPVAVDINSDKVVDYIYAAICLVTFGKST